MPSNASQQTSTPTSAQTPAPSSSPKSSAAGGLKASLVGKSFAEQEAALAPRDAAPVQLKAGAQPAGAAKKDAPAPVAKPPVGGAAPPTNGAPAGDAKAGANDAKAGANDAKNDPKDQKAAPAVRVKTGTKDQERQCDAYRVELEFPAAKALASYANSTYATERASFFAAVKTWDYKKADGHRTTIIAALPKLTEVDRDVVAALPQLEWLVSKDEATAKTRGPDPAQAAKDQARATLRDNARRRHTLTQPELDALHAGVKAAKPSLAVFQAFGAAIQTSQEVTTETLDSLFKAGVIRAGKMGDSYYTTSDRKKGQFSVAVPVLGPLELELHAHCNADGSFQAGANAVHYKAKSVAFEPGKSHPIPDSMLSFFDKEKLAAIAASKSAKKQPQDLD